MHPNISSQPSSSLDHRYDESVSNSVESLFSSHQGNLFKFYAENNNGSDVFFQFFDKATAGEVTLGTTAPDFTLRIPANGSLGLDFIGIAIHYFAKGCQYACTSTRSGAGAPASAATAQFWSWSSNP